MLKTSTLLGQIIICISLSLPIPTFLVQGGGILALMAYFFIWLIPIIVFFMLFSLKTSKGSEFKEMRLSVAMLLWSAFFIVSFAYNNFRGLLKWIGYDRGAIAIWTIKGYGFDSTHIVAAIFAIYNAMAITMVVILSYEISKWINGKIDKYDDQIDEKRE